MWGTKETKRKGSWQIATRHHKRGPCQDIYTLVWLDYWFADRQMMFLSGHRNETKNGKQRSNRWRKGRVEAGTIKILVRQKDEIWVVNWAGRARSPGSLHLTFYHKAMVRTIDPPGEVNRVLPQRQISSYCQNGQLGTWPTRVSFYGRHS